MLLCSLLLFVALPARAASVTSTWLGGTGDWTDPAHWNGAVVPQNTGTDSYDAAIDGGNPGASEVTLDSQDTIGSLQVDAGDALVVTPTGQLTLDGDRIENAGEVTLHGIGSGYPPPSLVASAPDTVISGGGSMVLDGGDLFGSSLANMDNRIAGWGTITSETGVQGGEGFRNYGVVEANVAGKTLGVGNSGVNYGTMRAVGGGTLLLQGGGTVYLNRGSVEALDGSEVGSNDFFESLGGSFTALRHSTMNLAGSYSDGTQFVTDADSQISLDDYTHGTLDGVTFDGQIELRDSGVSGTITNRGLIRGGVTAVGPTTIVNQGRIVLQYEESQHGDVLSFAGGGTVTLDATNADPGYRPGPIRNVDNEMYGTGRLGLLQNGGLIEASGGALQIGGSQLDHTGVFAAAPGGSLAMAATVTGAGSWRADGGQIHVTGNVGTTGDIEVLHSGSLAVDTVMSGNDLVVDNTSSLDVQGILRLAGDIDLDGANNGRWHFGPSASLEINGARGAAIGDWGDWQFLEATGINLFLQPVDGGIMSTGLYLPEIVIGPDGRLVLRDRRDNGNRPFNLPEVVYVDTLVFSDSLGLLNLNGIALYYNHLVGSAEQIINVAVPEPGAGWLLGAAFAFVVAARELRNKEP